MQCIYEFKKLGQGILMLFQNVYIGNNQNHEEQFFQAVL